MKWKNKGHEFDDVYENLRQKKKFYLFGAGRDGKLVLGVLRKLFGDTIEIAGYWDNDPQKNGSMYEGLPVTRPQAAADIPGGGIGIILSVGLAGSYQLEQQLTSLGWKNREDFCHYYVFLGVFAAYREKKLYFPSISFLPTTYCNLNCRACLNFTPFAKEFHHRNFDDIKKDLDLFFSVVDYIGFFHVSGGEPLLYPEIAELLQYISERFGKQIYSLQTTTNGTILPSEKLLDVFRTHDITITIDDYRGALLPEQEKYQEVYDAFAKAAGADHVIQGKYDSWMDLAPDREYPAMTEDELRAHFDSCRIPWKSYHDGKLYLCNYADYAVAAGIGPVMGEEEYIDFSTYQKEQDLKSFMEFRMGYSMLGYTQFCKQCAGYTDINPYHVKPAEQVPRR